MSIEAASRAMRHRTTRTTEMYYARVRPTDLWRRSGGRRVLRRSKPLIKLDSFEGDRRRPDLNRRPPG